MSKIICIILLIVLTSCKSVRDGLSGKKTESSDEFLIEKKNPLTLPPEYGKLPVPNEDIIEESKNEDITTKSLLGANNKKKITSSNTDLKSVEEYILKEINKN